VLKLVQETAFSQAVFLWSEVGDDDDDDDDDDDERPCS
jgi:hypothetical protein